MPCSVRWEEGRTLDIAVGAIRTWTMPRRVYSGKRIGQDLSMRKDQNIQTKASSISGIGKETGGRLRARGRTVKSQRKGGGVRELSPKKEKRRGSLVFDRTNKGCKGSFVMKGKKGASSELKSEYSKKLSQG